jgi:serine/threonine protein kinase
LIDEKASMAMRAAAVSTPPPAPAPAPTPEAETKPSSQNGGVTDGMLALAPAPQSMDEVPTLVKEPGGKRLSQPPLTETGVVFGTPSYMAAELIAGTKNATRSADVFSLAVIAFEILTGRRPFKESPLQARMDGREISVAPRFRDACPTLDHKVAEMLDRAIGHDPTARPTAQELSLALAAASEQRA